MTKAASEAIPELPSRRERRVHEMHERILGAAMARFLGDALRARKGVVAPARRPAPRARR